jgi:dihydrofolate reductase
MTTTSAEPSISEHNEADMGLELTLIVAATSKMGIGLRGALLWEGLKKEMAYFKRVTQRVVGKGLGKVEGESKGNGEVTYRNTVIMGRKTWDSIPNKFRPLGGRRNFVVSRSLKVSEKEEGSDDGPVIVPSLDSAVELLGKDKGQRERGRIFVIGGAQIYKAAMERREAKRILLTRVKGEFECNTLFPADLGVEGEGNAGWVKKESEELRSGRGKGGVCFGGG